MNPIDNPAQIEAERTVVALWQRDDIRAARQIVGTMWRNAWEDAPPQEARLNFEAFVDEYMANWMFKAVASDARHPAFVRNFMPSYAWHGHEVPAARTGGDNPDNAYRLAGVEHGSSYSITCRPRGREPAHTSFNLVGNFGTSVIIQSTESQLVLREADGSFVITIDDHPANGRPNHLTTQPHAKFLFVRDPWRTGRPRHRSTLQSSDWARRRARRSALMTSQSGPYFGPAKMSRSISGFRAGWRTCGRTE